MELSVLFLGTAGSVPTPSRGLSATMVQRGGDRFLVDCGEGTQRQLIRIGIGINDISHVLLTHLHADHYLGLPGMMKTWQLWGRTDPVTVYGPRGFLDFLDVMKRLVGKTEYPVSYHEMAPGGLIPFDDFQIEGIATQHKINSIGYRLSEHERPGRFNPERARELGVTPGPDFGRLQHGQSVWVGDREVRPSEVMGESRTGRTIVVTGDTRPCRTVAEAARRADLLVHDCTFTMDEHERARHTMHSTAAEAAEIGREADVKLLALTHLSFRHHARDMVAEAKPIFDRIVVPSDFDRLVIPYSEKGAAYMQRSDVYA
jgi:ribonuclease Z